jgi:Gly-Xaa carboxypeptidase
MRGLLDEGEAASAQRKSWLRGTGYTVAGLAAIGLLAYWWPAIGSHGGNGCPSKAPAFNESMCAQPEVIVPPVGPGAKFSSAADLFFSEKYKKHSVDVWGGAVKIPTQSFDDFGEVGVDPRYEIFYEFADYLKEKFPTVHKYSSLEKVNTHGLLFTFQGSNPDLKPLVLMSHQDVVPVLPDTLDKWTHPPFSGYFDGKYLWGRGSSDCKNQLLSLMESMEALLIQGFEPERTVLFSFGFDEEVSGVRGAVNLAARIEEIYGKDSIFMIVDEGSGISDFYGTTFAIPAVGEKGYIDAIITLNTPGGHSSIPPPHTGIGIVAELVTMLESNPFEADITPRNPFYHLLKCAAGHAKELDPSTKDDILLLDQCPVAKERVIDEVTQNPFVKYVLQTSQAADIIRGGLKINALPEAVTVEVNHRVAVESNTDAVRERIIHYTTTVAEKYGFSVNAFGEDVVVGDSEKGLFTITDRKSLEPAPVTPTSGKAWEILGGTTRHVFQDVVPFADGSDIIFGPGIMTGNTDTRYYWDLTRNIFRYGPTHESKAFNVHTVDERVELDAHLGMVSFFYELILNVDAYKGN